MRAMTLWQPWASAIALGVKKVETRSWSTSYRGEIAIHASSTRRQEAQRAGAYAPVWASMRAAGCNRTLIELPHGAIVAVALLTSCRCVARPDERTDGTTGLVLASAFTDDERRAGDFTPGRFAWSLEFVRAIAPVTATGARGLWTVPDETERTLRLMLGEKPERRPARVRADLE